MATKSDSKPPTKAIARASAKTPVAAPKLNFSQIAFKYIFKDDYNPIYANGAFGGVTTQGEIVLNFYLERQPLPLVDTNEVSLAGGLGKIVSREPKAADGELHVVRYVSNGTVLSLATAKLIHEFLGNQIKHIESLDAARLKAD